MARRKIAGVAEHMKAGPVPRPLGPPGEEIRKFVAGFSKFLAAAAKGIGSKQGGGGLAERAGLHLLPDLDHPSLPVHDEIDDDPAAAERRTLLDTRLRPLEPPKVRDGRREAQYVSIIEADRHAGAYR